MLGKVGVLILVDKHISEILLIFPADIRIITQQHIRVIQQVVKIHGSGMAATRAVCTVYSTERRALRSLVGRHLSGIGNIHVRRYQRVFRIGYGSDNGGRLVYLVVKLHITQYSLYQRFGVGRIIYRKTALKPDKVGVEAQQSGENTVECPHPQLRGHSRADHLLDALPHLFGGLVGKCKSQYTPWLIAMVQQMYNLICEHTCLARPGAGYYQLRAIIVDYGVALLVIQLQKIVIFFGHITSRLPASR